MEEIYLKLLCDYMEQTQNVLKFITHEITKLNALVANYIIMCGKNTPGLDIEQLRKETKQILDPHNDGIYNKK